jgi:tetratricopeptide (TPR) repeat protein
MDDQGKPIEAVKVKLFFTKTETGFENVTDSQGIWKASWIKGGTWNIDFEKLDDPTVLYNVGTYLYNGAQYEEALKFYKKAVDVQADFLDAICQLGLAYLTTQKKDEAIAVFEKYLTLDAASDKATQVRNFLDYLKNSKRATEFPYFEFLNFRGLKSDLSNKRVGHD